MQSADHVGRQGMFEPAGPELHSSFGTSFAEDATLARSHLPNPR